MIEIDGKTFRIGLALSGGGFRASIFHMGVMRRLQELGILEKIDVISAVSGGAIVAAYYCLELNKGSNLDDIEKGFTKGLQADIRRRSLEFSFLFHPLLFLMTSTPWFTRTNIIAKEFDKHFFHGRTLGQLPESPKLVINATNLNSAAVWRFRRDRMGDWKFGSGRSTDFPVKDAVAASAAVPGIFAPLVLSRKNLKAVTPKEKYENYKHVSLVDGGLRDNQGVTDLLFEEDPRCHYVIASDASGPIERKSKNYKWFSVLLRSNEVIMDATRDWLIDGILKKSIWECKTRDKKDDEILGAVWFTLEDRVKGRSWKLPDKLVIVPEDCGPGEDCDPGPVARIRTDLDYFDDDEILALKYHGYTLTDDHVKRYAPYLIQTEDHGLKWCEKFDETRISQFKQALAKSHRNIRPLRVARLFGANFKAGLRRVAHL